MSQLPPPMPTIPYQTPRLLSFRDRSGMLQVVGILFIIGGALCGCLTAMTPMALVAPRPSGVPPQQVGAIATAVGMYGVLCGVMLTLGIGCTRKRRWTRPVILVLGWIGLVIGVMGMLFWTAAAPQMGEAMRASRPAGAPAMPQAFVTPMIVVTSAFMLLIYVVIPAGLLWLFRGEDVRATLEHYDPVTRWTDGVPLPVLGVSALLVFGAIWALMALAQGWFFFMGALLIGMTARVAAVVVAGSFVVAAYLAFRRTRVGWMMALALFIVLPVAWITTLLRHDMIDVYRATGMDATQLRVIEKMPAMASPMMAVSIGVTALAAIVFTIRARRYFLAPPDAS
jgi:hypothetical protein